jgi:hypothetical protein
MKDRHTDMHCNQWIDRQKKGSLGEFKVKSISKEAYDHPESINEKISITSWDP